MSYSIIFETKFVKLPDGRFLHLSLQGCNNDNAGRTRDDFHGKIYTKESLSEYIDSFRHGTDYEDSMKIGNKWRSFKEYAEHLERMLKRATTWEELCEERYCYARIFYGVWLTEEGKEKRYVPHDEWNKICYDVYYGRIKASYIRDTKRVEDISEIVAELDKKTPMRFYIGTKNRRVR